MTKITQRKLERRIFELKRGKDGVIKIKGGKPIQVFTGEYKPPLPKMEEKLTYNGVKMIVKVSDGQAISLKREYLRQKKAGKI